MSCLLAGLLNVILGSAQAYRTHAALCQLRIRNAVTIESSHKCCLLQNSLLGSPEGEDAHTHPLVAAPRSCHVHTHDSTQPSLQVSLHPYTRQHVGLGLTYDLI